ncbi:MAG: L,D-transpeptidase [Bauldia sp.]|nr:L,D-transpeptidase [Bauldia sp.]
MVARIDLSDQTMTIYVEERLAYVFKVSTARKGYITPVGFYQAEWLSPRHRSRKYDNAPMPWSVFFHQGWAIHGTTDIKRLGKPASHGCVRLHPDNAKIFFQLVKEAGLDRTLISVVR